MGYIDYGKYNSGSFITWLSGRARKKMYCRFIEYAAPTPKSRVLDVGVTPDNSREFHNFFEKMYPWTSNITMCSVEDADNLLKEFPGAKFVRNEPGGG